MTMQVQTYSLTTDHRTTPATLTAYLQTPTPGSTVQQFAPLLIIPGGSMTHIPVEETEKTALAFASRRFRHTTSPTGRSLTRMSSDKALSF